MSIKENERIEGQCSELSYLSERYPKLGATAKGLAIVTDETGKQSGVEEFEGVVMNVHIDPDGRESVQLKSGDSVKNVHLATIGYDDAYKERYEIAVSECAEETQRANDEIKELAKAGNAAIDKLYDGVLGEAHDLKAL